jgi:hypothetical protein
MELIMFYKIDLNGKDFIKKQFCKNLLLPI